MTKCGIALAVLILAATSGWAAPIQSCSSGTLSSYLALGSAGCSAGNLDYSNFEYSTSTPGDMYTHASSASSVGVTVVSSGLSFDGAWWASDDFPNFEYSNFVVSYTVTEMDPNSPLNGAGLMFQGAGSDEGVALVLWTIPAGPIGVSKTLGTNSGDSTSSLSFAPVSSLSVTDIGTVGANSSIWGFADQFSEDPVVPAPEPSSLLLLGISFGALLIFGRKLFGAYSAAPGPAQL